MVNVDINLTKDAKELYTYLGFSTFDEFVNDAVNKRILELKKTEFYKIVAELRKAMVDKKIDEKELISDFERVKHED